MHVGCLCVRSDLGWALQAKPSRLECRFKRWCQVTVSNLILKVDFLVLTLGRRNEDLRRALGRS